MNKFNKNKILITGGSGFIETNIIDFYKDRCQVLNLDIKAPRNKKHNKYWEQVNILVSLYFVLKSNKNS